MALTAGTECVAGKGDASHDEVEDIVDDGRSNRESAGELHALAASEQVKVVANDSACDLALKSVHFPQLEQETLLDSACTDSGRFTLFELSDDVLGVFDRAVSAKGDFFDRFVQVSVFVEAADSKLSGSAEVFGELRQKLGTQVLVERGFGGREIDPAWRDIVGRQGSPELAVVAVRFEFAGG